jgi:hypothetical protein
MGVNDDLSLNSLGQATMDDAIWLTKLVASDIDNDLQGMPNAYRNTTHYVRKCTESRRNVT